MPGTQVFTYLNYGKETTRGTPVAPTRQLYAGGTGVLTPDFGQNFHEAENTGRRYRTRRVTRTKEDWGLSIQTPTGVSYDDLILPFAMIAGGKTGVGGAADKTWTMTPSATAANVPDAFSFDVGDEIQNWRCQYVMARRFKISADLDDVTQLEMDCFAQRAIKVAKATPAINSSIKIPSDLWTMKIAASIAGLGAASVIDNFLIGWDLEVVPGNIWRHYLSGNLYGSGHVETDIAWTLNLKVEATAQAVTEFYDKAAADTMSFIRLKATGPTLGGTNYSAQIDTPVLYEEPEIIAEEDEGVNIWNIEAHGSDDGTNGIIPVFVNSLAALP